MNPYEPILQEVASGLLDFPEIKPNFSNDAFFDATIIFQSVFVDKVFDNQNYDNMPMKYREEMIQKAGEDLRKLIHTYTNLDTHQLANDYGSKTTTQKH